MGSSLLSRLDARDRALYARWTISRERASRRVWIALTHMGGAWITISASVLPLMLGGLIRAVALQALIALAISHGIVQIIKRNVLRARPDSRESLVAIPDEFSFPSGHATAAMAVAGIYAVSFPALALPLLVVATAVGFSRVVLGVHYPGDVLAGQAIALVTDLVVLAVR